MSLSDYWQLFGYTDESAFVDAVSPYMPSLRYWGLGWDAEQMSHYAWSNPASAFGSVAATVLTVKTVSGDSPTQQTTAGALAGRYIDSTQGAQAMPALIIPGTFLCSIKMSSGGQDVINVIGVRNSGGTAAGAAAAVDAAWQAASGPLSQLSTTTTYSGVHAMDLSSADGAISDLAVTGKAGGASGALATNAACALVKWNGGTRSGSSRGRLYFGPLLEVAVNSDGRTLASTWQTAFQNAITVFRNSLNSANYPLVVISRKNAVATTVTSHAVENVIATQRRRIRG